MFPLKDPENPSWPLPALGTPVFLAGGGTTPVSASVFTWLLLCLSVASLIKRIPVIGFRAHSKFSTRSSQDIPVFRKYKSKF